MKKNLLACLLVFALIGCLILTSCPNGVSFSPLPPSSENPGSGGGTENPPDLPEYDPELPQGTNVFKVAVTNPASNADFTDFDGSLVAGFEAVKDSEGPFTLTFDVTLTDLGEDLIISEATETEVAKVESASIFIKPKYEKTDGVADFAQVFVDGKAAMTPVEVKKNRAGSAVPVSLVLKNAVGHNAGTVVLELSYSKGIYDTAKVPGKLTILVAGENAGSEAPDPGPQFPGNVKDKSFKRRDGAVLHTYAFTPDGTSVKHTEEVWKGATEEKEYAYSSESSETSAVYGELSLSLGSAGNSLYSGSAELGIIDSKFTDPLPVFAEKVKGKTFIYREKTGAAYSFVVSKYTFSADGISVKYSEIDYPSTELVSTENSLSSITSVSEASFGDNDAKHMVDGSVLYINGEEVARDEEDTDMEFALQVRNTRFSYSSGKYTEFSGTYGYETLNLAGFASMYNPGKYTFVQFIKNRRPVEAVYKKDDKYYRFKIESKKIYRTTTGPTTIADALGWGLWDSGNWGTRP